MIAPGEFYEVEMPAYNGPAFHVCRFPVQRPRQIRREMIVPFPKRDAWLPGALAVESLLLPEGYAGRRWPLLPREIQGPALSALWATDHDLPLLLPAATLHERRMDLEWRAKLLVTPTVVGLVAHPDTIAHVAWAVLCRADPALAVLVLCRLSCLADRYCMEPAWMAALVGAMRPPSAVEGQLLAAARSGEPILHPRGIRWVLGEIAAASPQERAERAAWRPDELDEASLIGRAWFRCLRSGRPAATDEILLATWMLHEVFHGATTEEDPGWDGILSMTTTIGYNFEVGGSWFRTLDRWLSIWQVSDTHPSVVDAALRPSELRAAYEHLLGVDVRSWLAGVWFLCVRWWLSLGEGHPVPTSPEELFRFPLQEANVELSDEFRQAFRHRMVQSLDEFAAAARDEAPGGYQGLGSLPQHDSLACRNFPVLELLDGQLVPMSVQLVAERAVVLHRLLLGPRSREATTFGTMFEAYIADSLDRLKARKVVVSEAEITSVLGMNSRCDGLVVDGWDYLAIETSVQTLSRGVATGNVDAIHSMADRYQKEADQAVATISRLTDLSLALGLPRPATATHLVVTETSVPHSPAFLRALRELRAGRTAKFVCSAEDLDELISLGLAGWSVPLAVQAWQGKEADIPLSAHLRDMARTAGRVRTLRRAEDWLTLLPLRSPLAA